MKRIKVLIISHNPITTYHNMGKTMKSLFQDFSMNEMCQLYCYPTIPDVDVCSSYYRITDKEILHSLLHPLQKKGRVISKCEIKVENSLYENEQDRKRYQVTQEYKRLLRDWMWKVVNWYTDDLKDWLKNEKPTCIFVAPGDAEFLYNISMRISKDFSLPLISYICDDYYFSKSENGFWGKLRTSSLKYKIRSFFKKVDYSVFICDELKAVYEKEFMILGKVIMTGAEVHDDRIQIPKTTNSIIYMGNIRCGRYKTLREIGIILDDINKEDSKNYELLIYTDEHDKSIIGCLEEIDSIKLNGFIKGEEYNRVVNAAGLFLHVESFEQQYSELVKFSISTKIAGSLASGVPLLAYGPSDISSMKYLIREECAIVAVQKKELKNKVRQALADVTERERVARCGILVAKKNHDMKTNSLILRKIMDR